MTKILVVDDQVLFRDALVKLINSQSDMKVVATANEAKDAPEICEKLAPDLVLMDILTDPPQQSPTAVTGPTGISVTAQIREQFPSVKVIIMTGLAEISVSEAAKKAGAHSFINKNIHEERFLSIIRNTMEGYNTFPEIVSSQLPFSVTFSDREMKVLRLFCKGKTRPEIAAELDMSEALVKAVVTSLLNKTGFDSILRLAVYLTSNGYIVPNVAK